MQILSRYGAALLIGALLLAEPRIAALVIVILLARLDLFSGTER
jgi:hypothetical protein